mmetsp:Transcript_2165/g.6248  ORF Transcript_2165/g.6248 Transcript_2165/m.6248 type:complete len:224 (-) Transcript_2165:40-711(-)
MHCFPLPWPAPRCPAWSGKALTRCARLRAFRQGRSRRALPCLERQRAHGRGGEASVGPRAEAATVARAPAPSQSHQGRCLAGVNSWCRRFRAACQGPAIPCSPRCQRSPRCRPGLDAWQEARGFARRRSSRYHLARRRWSAQQPCRPRGCHGGDDPQRRTRLAPWLRRACLLEHLASREEERAPPCRWDGYWQERVTWQGDVQCLSHPRWRSLCRRTCRWRVA